jgi:uncharacterized BrkB/YihY/UPF0761 family membrane protein
MSRRHHTEGAGEPTSPAESGLERLALRTKSVTGPVKARWTRRLARYHDLPVVDVLIATYYRDRESAGAVVGSAVAFRVFQFFVPFLLFIVGVAALISGFVSAGDVDRVVGVSGDLAHQVQAAFAHRSQDRWLVTLIGLFGMAVAGRSLSRVLFTASAVAWRMPAGNRAPLRVVGSIAGLVFGVGFVVVLINRARIELGYGVAGLSFGPALAVYVLAWLGISTLLPRATEDPGVLLPGSALVGLTITAMQSLSQFYLPSQLTRAGELYGAIGTTVVTLGWFFFLGRAISFALVLNPVIYEKYGSVSTLVFSLPVLRALARRSARLRRFFALDARPPSAGDPS